MTEVVPIAVRSGSIGAGSVGSTRAATREARVGSRSRVASTRGETAGGSAAASRVTSVWREREPAGWVTSVRGAMAPVASARGRAAPVGSARGVAAPVGSVRGVMAPAVASARGAMTVGRVGS
jgi:hypothetical protein